MIIIIVFLVALPANLEQHLSGEQFLTSSSLSFLWSLLSASLPANAEQHLSGEQQHDHLPCAGRHHHQCHGWKINLGMYDDYDEQDYNDEEDNVPHG